MLSIGVERLGYPSKNRIIVGKKSLVTKLAPSEETSVCKLLTALSFKEFAAHTCRGGSIGDFFCYSSGIFYINPNGATQVHTWNIRIMSPIWIVQLVDWLMYKFI